MKLQTNPEEKPDRIGFSEHLQRAMELCEVLDKAGLQDNSSANFEVTKDLVRDCVRILAGNRQALHLYLSNLKGVPYQRRGTVFRVAVRMAANKQEFVYGRCPEVGATYSKDYWAGAYILDTGEFYDPKRKRHRIAVKFLVMTGPLAGAIIVSEFAKGFLAVLRIEIGAALRGKESQLPEAGNMRNVHLCQVAIFVQNKQELVVSKVGGTKSMLTYNKRLVRSRLREISECPFGATFDCVSCSALTTDCQRSVNLE